MRFIPSNLRRSSEFGPILVSLMSIALSPDAIPMIMSNSRAVICSCLLPMLNVLLFLSYVLRIFSTPDFVPFMLSGVTALSMKGIRKW